MSNIKIKKIRTNFQVRFNYNEELIKYIKTIPSDQLKTSFQTLIVDGKAKKDWFHICNAHGLMKILWYCLDNHIQYNYENISETDIYKIESYVKRKKEQIQNIQNFRKNDIDVSQDDFSFMKIQPYPYQKKAVRFFDLCNGVAILGDQPGVGKTLSAIAYSIKHNFKTIIVCPASLVLVWAKEIVRFTNEKPFVFKYKIKKKNNLGFSENSNESNIHIVSYSSLDTYLKFDVHHKCQNPYCDFEETSQIKKYKICPKCFKEKSIKSKNTELCTFVDKKGQDIKSGIYNLIVMDECFVYDTLIETEFGKIPIGDIVEFNLNLKILSFNHKTKQNEYKKINRFIKKDTTNDLLKITLKNNKTFICTKNHKIYTNEEGYIEAGKLKLEHTLQILPEKINKNSINKKEQVLQQNKISNRGGWSNSQIKKMEIFRQKKNRCFELVGLESIEVLELGCGQLSKYNNNGYNETYNLEIDENHNYYANDTLVSNCHYIKNPKAQRTKLIVKAFKSIPKKLLLSGTAIKSKPFEFFVLLNFLDPFEWVNSHTYGVKYCDGKQDEYGHWNYNGYSNVENLVERLSSIYLRRKKSDPGVLEHLPPKTFTIIPITLTPEESKQYRDIEENIINEIKVGDDKMTHLQKIQKLKFFTATICAQRAFEFIQNIIDGDEKIVVFSQYINTSKIIYEHFKENAVWYTGKHSDEQKEEAKESFMEDENIKVFSGTIGAAGVGLTLTSASTVLSLDQPWTPSDREQLEDRVHRASQTSNKVHIIRLICQGTIDEDIETLLNDKEKITSQVLDGEYIEKEINYSVFDDIVNIILKKKK